MKQTTYTTYKFLQELYLIRKTGRQKPPRVCGGAVVVLADPGKWHWDGLPEFSLGVLAGDTRRFYREGDVLPLHFNAQARLTPTSCLGTGSPCCLTTPVECLRYMGFEIEWEYRTESGGSHYQWSPVFEFYQSLEEAEMQPEPATAAQFGAAMVKGVKLSLNSFAPGSGVATGEPTQTVVGAYALLSQRGQSYCAVDLKANRPCPVVVLFSVRQSTPGQGQTIQYYRQLRYLLTLDGTYHTAVSLKAMSEMAPQVPVESQPVYRYQD